MRSHDIDMRVAASCCSLALRPSLWLHYSSSMRWALSEHFSACFFKLYSLFVEFVELKMWVFLTSCDVRLHLTLILVTSYSGWSKFQTWQMGSRGLGPRMLKYLLLHFPQLLSATQIVQRPQWSQWPQGSTKGSAFQTSSFFFTTSCIWSILI